MITKLSTFVETGTCKISVGDIAKLEPFLKYGFTSDMGDGVLDIISSIVCQVINPQRDKVAFLKRENKK